MKRRFFGMRISCLVAALVATLVVAHDVCIGATEASLQTNTSKVDIAVAEIGALRDAAKFVEARDAVRKAIQECTSESDIAKLRDMEMVIRDQVRDFIKMKSDIEQLDARDGSARKVAVDRLLGEDVGKIVLRQTVREGTVPAAVAAGRGLAETKDSVGIQAVIARAKTEKDVAGATDLLATLPDVSKFVALVELPALAASAHGKPAVARAPVKELMKRRAVGPFSNGELRGIADLAAGPDSPARRGAMDFLGIVFRVNAKRDPEAFNKLVGENCHAMLMAALEKDRTAEDGQLAAWAKQQWVAMLRIDRDALANGLHAHWTLDRLGENQFNDSGPSGRNLYAKNVGTSQIVPGILGKALACTNENAVVEWGDRAYRELQTNDFSLSTWINILRLEPTVGDTESVILGSEVRDGRTSGLILGADGVVHFYLPIMVQPQLESAQQSSVANDEKKRVAHETDRKKRPARPILEYVHASTPQHLTTNRWYHLAAAVSRASSEVTLYLDGEVACREVSKTNATPAGVEGSLRVGASRSQSRERRNANCFYGSFDDIRIYNRAITATDAAILYAQGEGDQ